MKTNILSLIAVILMVGCTSTGLMRRTLDKVYLGMSISEFKANARKPALVSMKDNFVCYRCQYIHESVQTRFFYFKDDKLYQIDEGVREADVNIKVN